MCYRKKSTSRHTPLSRYFLKNLKLEFSWIEPLDVTCTYKVQTKNFEKKYLRHIQFREKWKFFAKNENEPYLEKTIRLACFFIEKYSHFNCLQEGSNCVILCSYYLNRIWTVFNYPYHAINTLILKAYKCKNN